MAQRKKHQKTEYEKALREYHRRSPRHVVVFEAILPEDTKRHFFREADLIRQCGNKLTGIMQRNLEQLLRTKKYRALQKCYGKLSEKINTLNGLKSRTKEQGATLKKLGEDRKTIAQSMAEMQTSYNVTWDFCRKTMEQICQTCNGNSIFLLSRAEDVWSAVEKVLYSNGKALHFKKRGDLPELRAKQANRCIIITEKDGGLIFKYARKGIPYKRNPKDLWLMDEISAIETYLADSRTCDAHAIHEMKSHNNIASTYRPCFASIVCKKIRGKLRVYIHVTVEGTSLPKKTRGSAAKHKYRKGIVGCDIGTQTIAYTSDSAVGLENLAERGNSIQRIERQERLVLRAMDRSRRAMNPDNYNSDGTVRKGKKVWRKSNRYRRLQKRHQELCCIAAENRKLAINEQVHKMRSLGDVFVTEPKNAKKLQKRANPEEPLDKNGKPKRKKRFGKSIKNRCPGYFQAKVKQVFQNTGGKYIEVPGKYRASQYDHTADDYIEKKLSDRMYPLSDGTVVQRDWYSSYLMYSIDTNTLEINKKKCVTNFSEFYKKEQAMVETIARSGKKVMNSGIRAIA